MPSWFTKWSYSEDADLVFCHICILALKQKKIQPNRGDTSFISKGCNNWKDGTIGVKYHEASASHKELLQVVVLLPKTCSDIGDMLSRQHAHTKKYNRKCLLKILSNL